MGYKDLVEIKKEFNSGLFEKFINMSMTSTLQEEFYTQKDEQTKKSLKIHNEMFVDNRKMYAITLLLPINDIHRACIIRNLLKDNTKEKNQKDFENNLILDVLSKLPTNRAYKTLLMLIQNRLNNTRVRWLMRQFLRERKNLRFEAVKYKKAMIAIFKHAHVNAEKLLKDKQIDYFLFANQKDKETGKKKKTLLTHGLFKDYIKAAKDKKAVFKSPYSVAEGFKNLHKISDKQFMEGFKGKLTVGEQRRVQRRAGKAGVIVEMDLSKQSTINIFQILREEGERTGSLAKFESSCKNEASKLFKHFDFKNVKIVLDNSGSMYGSEEKKYHPISVGEAIANVLKYLSDESEIISVPNEGSFLSDVDGESNIADGILKALEDIDLEKDNLIIIISDAYENAPAGLSNQILTVFKKKIDKKEKTVIIHLNPVFAPEAEDIKKLSEVIQTFGIRDTRQLFIVLLLALIRNKKDKKIRQIINDMKQKVIIRERKKKKKVEV